MSNIPWWNILVAPGATLLAFTLGVLAAWWNDRRRWEREDHVRVLTLQREDEVRYHKERLETYTKYMSLGNKIMVLTAAERQNEVEDKAIRELIVELARVKLLATPEVTERAAEIFNYLLDTNSQERSYVIYSEKEGKFTEAVRRELGADAIVPPSMSQDVKRQQQKTG